MRGWSVGLGSLLHGVRVHCRALRGREGIGDTELYDKPPLSPRYLPLLADFGARINLGKTLLNFFFTYFGMTTLLFPELLETLAWMAGLVEYAG